MLKCIYIKTHSSISYQFYWSFIDLLRVDVAINYNIFKEFGNLNMDKEQSYFVEDFSHSFQTLSVHFKQSLDDLAKQFSGKNLS